MGNDPESWVELLATVAGLWGPEVAATGWAEQAAAPAGLLRHAGPGMEGWR